MERRAFLLGVSGLGLGIGAAAALPERAEAASHTRCAVDKKRKLKLCTAAPPRRIKLVTVRRGAPPRAAWVACLSMVFEYHGHPCSPLRISRDLYGGKVPDAPWKDLTRLAREFTDDKGKPFAIAVEALPVSAADAAEVLAADEPLIIGLFGHPVLLTSLSYTGDRLGGMKIDSAVVRDPLPGSHHDPRPVTSPDWVDVRYMARVTARKPKSGR
ncbi:MAG: hypothetical protein U1A78_21580 [Polyangia bacterium]